MPTNTATFKRVEQTIEEAKAALERRKMKPLHRASSFTSWRSALERRLDRGLTFAGVGKRVGSSMPRRYRKHLSLLRQKQRSAARSEMGSDDERAESTLNVEDSYLCSSASECAAVGRAEAAREAEEMEPPAAGAAQGAVPRRELRARRADLVAKIREKLRLKAKKAHEVATSVTPQPVSIEIANGPPLALVAAGSSLLEASLPEPSLDGA